MAGIECGGGERVKTVEEEMLELKENQGRYMELRCEDEEDGTLSVEEHEELKWLAVWLEERGVRL